MRTEELIDHEKAQQGDTGQMLATFFVDSIGADISLRKRTTLLLCSYTEMLLLFRNVRVFRSLEMSV
jgi:hypothetical protein